MPGSRLHVATPFAMGLPPKRSFAHWRKDYKAFEAAITADYDA
jgi:hypothetical protein